MQCDMCGKETSILYKTEVEGVIMHLCKQCSRYGRVISRIGQTQKEKKQDQAPKERIPLEMVEEIEIIVPNYGEIVKRAREKKGWKQEELAKRIAEKESLIHKIESNKQQPSIQVARKLERVLGIKLVERVVEKHNVIKDEKKKEDLTLGDIVEIKRR